MRKYRPRIRLVRLPETAAGPGCQQLLQSDVNAVGSEGDALNDSHVIEPIAVTFHSDEDQERTQNFLFYDCVFIAVTAYQNQLVNTEYTLCV